ncbi:MAG: DUF4382 domain-containing protein [bacterium]
MKSNKSLYAVIMSVLLIAAWGGCQAHEDSGSSVNADLSSADPGGEYREEDSDTTESSFGFLDLGITDTPVDELSAIVVQFTGVEIQTEGGNRLQFNFEKPRQIDLLALHGSDSDLLLDHQKLPAGRYNWIRLNVTEDGVNGPGSYVSLPDGTAHPLVIPSGDQSGLKLNNGFNVAAGDTASFTIEFNLRKSVHRPSPPSSGKYRLRPTLRLVDNIEAGSVAGSIDPALIYDPYGPACAIYIFEGRDITPHDMNGTASSPLTTAVIELNPDTGEYTYRAGFLVTGDYTLAFTCQAADDDPETDDSINFGETANVAVLAGAETTYDFLP